MNTGRIILDLRDQKGWSQSELANKSGISRVMIGKY
ncbi:helix-turn-helix domain-containing protein [Sphingobacterium endophyticum]